jgi:hypothetical protein
MDKPVVLTALGRMGRTPRTTSANNVTRADVVMKILPDGSIEGHSTAGMTGIGEISSRAARFNARHSPEEEVVKELLFRFNEKGMGSISNANPEALGEPYWVRSTFRLDALSNVPGRGALAMPVGLAPGAIAWVGSDKPLQKRVMPFVCRSQTMEEKYLLHLPRNVVLESVPNGVKYRDGPVIYESRYRRDGRSVSVERKLVIQRDSHVCDPKENDKLNALYAIVQRDLRSQIFYR